MNFEMMLNDLKIGKIIVLLFLGLAGPLITRLKLGLKISKNAMMSSLAI